MKIIETPLPGVILLEPQVYSDDRGFFMETYNADRFRALGIAEEFRQDNHSFSRGPVLRGLHYQEPHAQGKLIRCSRGSIWDVAVDVRKGSPTFGKWYGAELSESNRKIIWIPVGFAHGFCTLSEEADVLYKSTDVYHPECERSVLWNDPAIGIEWPLTRPLLSAKDAAAPLLSDAVLPEYGGERVLTGEQP